MPVRLVASDLDETLIPPERVLRGPVLDAVRACLGAGVPFVPATGRSMLDIRPTLEQLGLAGRADRYAITLNGCVVSDCAGRVLRFRGMPRELAERCFRIGAGLGLPMHVAGRDGTVLMWGLTDEERAYVGTRVVYREMEGDSLDEMGDEPIAKLLFVGESEAWLRERVAARPVVAELAADLDLTYSSTRYLEFQPRGINKGDGLRFLCELLGIDVADAMALGDSSNDAEMLEAAGLGVGVANVTDAARAACDVVCDAPWDAGVAEALRRFVPGVAEAMDAEGARA